MNKKFLSAILFGALMVTSTGTFVSCKDYDDDIDQINKELTDIKSAIAALQAKVDGGKYVTNVVKNGNGITVTWNDNSTSTIETIKGDKGEDGKNGTIVTIIDGYWAFDGVKSEYPAKGDKGDQGIKGDKGDKGDQGEAGPAGPAGEAGPAGPAGEAGPAGPAGPAGADGTNGTNGTNGVNGIDGADGHDAQISADGYWMVWDAAKGEYVTTEFIAGGATAAQVRGGWNIIVKDENGDEQRIFVPSTITMGYMDVLNANDAMDALYGINAEDVEYGPAKKTLKKGLYTTLDRDLQVVVNPQGTDASVYSYSLMNSANVDTELPFKEAVPFKGVLTTRATSENAVWVLPHDFVRYENIDDARTKNYLLFKANDGAKHALSLTATWNETTIKTPYNLSAQLKKIGAVTVEVENLENCAVNVDYTPWVDYSESEDGAAVYDYWITLKETPQNLKNAQLYGVEIDSEGHSFKFTRETGVNNHVDFVYNYILIDGTVVEGKVEFEAWQREEMANAHTITLERLYTAMDAKLIVADKNASNYNPLLKGSGLKAADRVFALNTEEYDLADMLNGMSDLEKVVWKAAIADGSVDISMIGGEGDNNEETLNTRLARNIRYAFNKANDKVTFQFLVSDSWENENFWLDNAYQLTLTVTDNDTKTPVASIVLPFEFTQPTLDITRVDGQFTQWIGDMLYAYGPMCDKKGNHAMHLPLYDSFNNVWVPESDKVAKYSETVANAEYYKIDFDATAYQYVYVINESQEGTMALSQLQYNAVYHELTTKANHETVKAEAQKVDKDGNQLEITVPMEASYKFYGVYDADVKDFKLVFASWLKHSKLNVKEAVYNTARKSHVVFLTNDNIDFKTPKGDAFYLFDDIDNGLVQKRAVKNGDSFNENEQHPFTTFGTAGEDDVVPGLFDVKDEKAAFFTAKQAYGNQDVIEVAAPVTMTADGTYFTLNATTGEREFKYDAISADANKVKIYNVPSIPAKADASVPGGYRKAFKGGMLIQLPTSVQDGQSVIVTVTLEDNWGYKNTFDIVVKKLN